MEMTVNEHKEHLLDIMDSMPDDVCGDWRDSLAYAIEIMSKYQKIQEIVRWNNAPSPYYKPDGQLFREIERVIKDEDKND